VTVATITFGDGRTIAHLDDAGAWHSDDLSAQVYLMTRFGPLAIPPSPAAGMSPFAGQARAAAEHLKAEIAWTAAAPGPTDRVY
jgi:hypothetical protein